jgi:hypothetical protein
VTRAASRFPFFAGVRAGAAPLVLWALHFAFCYGTTAVGCTAILRDGALLTPLHLRLLMAGGTALALAASAWLLVHACRGARRGQGDLLPTVRLASALLALVAIAWTGLPLAVLPACGSG